MLKKSIAERVLARALASGGDWAEIFLEDTDNTNMTMLDGKIETAQKGRLHGAGIRVLKGLMCVYAYTNTTDEAGLMKAAEQAASAIGEAGAAPGITLCERYITNIHPALYVPAGIDGGRKAALMTRASKAAKEYSSCISQVSVTYLDVDQNVLIANSDGLFTEDRRIRTRLSVQSVASDGSVNQTGSAGPGARMGFEFYDKIDVEAAAREASRIAETMLHAEECPAGRMPVIIDNGFGGVIFHEACGHSLEATSVARGASVFSGKLGQKIASDIVSAVDDGTLPGEWGSLNIDDEGTPTQRNLLIENGILKSYLIDKYNGRRMGMESTGSSRRQSYKYAPTSRMTNTFILPHGDKDIIASTAEALYCAKMGGGSVNPVTGEFNFAVLEGYIVKNGQIERPVRGATLIGKGSEILLDIDMIGDNLAQAQGMCGSLSGSIPTNVGQPMIRVKEMTVGGKK